MGDYREDFYERYAQATGQTRPLSPAEYEIAAHQFRSRWRRWLPKDRAVPILDLGCGAGEFLHFLRSEGYSATAGADRSPAQVARAARAGIPNVVCADAIEFLADRKEAYAVVAALNVFEHLRKDEIIVLLRLLWQALIPGGHALILTPNGLSPFGSCTRYWDFSHETGFTPASWRQLARISGFLDPVFEEYGPVAHSLLGIVRATLWQLVRLGLVALSYIEVGGPRDASWTYTADMKVILRKPRVGTELRAEG